MGQPRPMGMPQQGAYGQPGMQQPMYGQPQQSTHSNDPFGAL